MTSSNRTAKTYRTKSGKALTEADLDAMAEEVEHAEYDIDDIKTRRAAVP